MKSKVKFNENCECHLEFDIPQDIVDKTLNEIYDEIRKQAAIPGFRAGKAPLDLVIQHHSEYAKEEVLKRIIPDSYQKVVEEKNIDPVSLPEISDVVFDKGKNLTFKAKVEVRPAIRLKNYRGIKIRTKKISVVDDEISEVIQRLRQAHAQFQPLKETRAVEKGDYVISDVEAFIDGRAITKKNENMWLVAEKQDSLLGIGEHLIGLMPGQLKEIEAQIPKNYPDKKFAEKLALFKVFVKEIREKVLPVVDEEFAKDLGKDNLAVLKEELKKDLLERKEQDKRIEMKNQIIEKLIKEYEVTMPPAMVRKQFDALSKRLENEMMSKGINAAGVEAKIKEIVSKLKKDAEMQVRIYFILEAISAKENITVEDEEINKRLESIAQMSRKSLDAVRKHYEENGLLEGLEIQLREAKTLDWLLEAADITAE